MGFPFLCLCVFSYLVTECQGIKVRFFMNNWILYLRVRSSTDSGLIDFGMVGFLSLIFVGWSFVTAYWNPVCSGVILVGFLDWDRVRKKNCFVHSNMRLLQENLYVLESEHAYHNKIVTLLGIFCFFTNPSDMCEFFIYLTSNFNMMGKFQGWIRIQPKQVGKWLYIIKQFSRAE